MSSTKLKRTIVTAIIAMALADGSATAQKKFDTGATDTEIKIGTPCRTAVRHPRMA